MTAPGEEHPFPLRVGLAFGLPLLVAIVVGLFQFPVAPLGDDWIFFSHFDHIDLLPSGDRDHEAAILTNATEADGLRFRPFAYAHMWLERRLTGGSFAIGYLLGIVYLGLSGSMLALLLRALGLGLGTAVVAGILAIAHPAHCEVHGWASARIDTMAACYGVAALWLGVRGRPVLSGLAFVAAFGSKESAYPLVIVPALLALLSTRAPRVLLLRSLPAGIALASVAVAKVALVGAFFGGSWSRALGEIPLLDQVTGYLSYLVPLLLHPVSDCAPPGSSTVVGILFTVLLFAAVALAVVSTRSAPADAGRRPLALVLLLCSAVTVTVTFGVPARDDLGGGRLWFLPGLFLVGAIAAWGRTKPLAAVILPGLVLLHLNLTPYREANRRMGEALGVLSAQVADPGTALRVVDLPAGHGPVPVFALMTAYYHETLPPPRLEIARAFLSTDEQARLAPDALQDLDRRWRQEMARRKLTIVDYGWDEEGARLLRR